MSDVTQNRFDKYFSGSELVVAGKVLPSESSTLTSFITASAVSKDPPPPQRARRGTRLRLV